MFICSPFSHRQESKLQIFLFLFSLCSLSVELCDEVGSTTDSCHRYCQATSAESYCHKKSLRDGPLETLWGRGGGAEVQKKYSRKGKLNEKNSCTPIKTKKYSCHGLKQIHTWNLTAKNNSCGSKIPLPPITFLMVCP